MIPGRDVPICVDLVAATNQVVAAAQDARHRRLSDSAANRMSAKHVRALADRLCGGQRERIVAAVDPSVPGGAHPEDMTAIAVPPGVGCARRWHAVMERLGCNYLLVIGCDAPLVTVEGTRDVCRTLLALGRESVVVPLGMPAGSAPVGVGRDALQRLISSKAGRVASGVHAHQSAVDRTCLLDYQVDITLSSTLGRELAQEYLEGPVARSFSLHSLARYLFGQPGRLGGLLIPSLAKLGPRGAAAALQVQSARERKRRASGPVVVAGYYGFGNLGDEAILEAILHQLRGIRDGRVVVLSGNPQRTAKEHGVEAANLLAFDQILPLLNKASLLAIGGGGLLQNVFNVDRRDLLEQLQRPQGGLMHFFLLALAARALGCPMMTWSVGIDPAFREELAVDAAHLLVGMCDRVVVRDAESLAFCNGWKDLRGKVWLGADASIAHPAAGALERPDLASRSRQVLVVPRAWYTPATHPVEGGIVRDIAPALARVCDAIAEQGHSIILAALQTGETNLEDERQAQAITANMRQSSRAQVVQPASWAEFLQLAANSQAAICMRLHGAIAAVLAATPVIGIAYDPKIRVFMESVGLDDFVVGLGDFEASEGAALVEAWDRLGGQAEQIHAKLVAAGDRLRGAANVASDAARSILSHADGGSQT
jgi:polysaccharide pyruvyl transferase CsaB